jgi:tRNA(fMet)-specific endonuclease VapC
VKSEDLLSNFNVLPISDCVDYFVEEKCRLQFAGTPMANNFDLLIGCTAVVNDMVMVTENIKDFKNIENIVIENWISR